MALQIEPLAHRLKVLVFQVYKQFSVFLKYTLFITFLNDMNYWPILPFVSTERFMRFYLIFFCFPIHNNLTSFVLHMQLTRIGNNQMNQILFVKTSLNDELSNSNKLANELVERLKNQTNAKIITRDVAKEPLTHLTQLEMGAWMTPEVERTTKQKDLAIVSDSLIKELKQSDTVVIAMPMYNFGVPSTFKAWVDRIARAGITFRYTENGPVGLLENKKVIIVAARGGLYKGTVKDSQTQFIKDFFSFIGLNDVRFIYAEGLNMPDGHLSLAEAQSEIEHFEV